jgi:pimeloyl-ACP methyl ester carboxylesterase
MRHLPGFDLDDTRRTAHPRAATIGPSAPSRRNMTTPPTTAASASDRQSIPSTPDPAPRLAYDRVGRGEPLVLLHGQGFSRRCWDPVLDALTADREVIAVDLPGHGESPRQPKGRGSAPHDLAVAVGELLDQLEIPTAHVAGNSSGGWVALELGRLQRAKTVTALDPAGLWRKSAPRHIRVAMRQVRLTAKLTRRFAPNAPRTRVGRGLSLIQASGHPFKLPYDPVRTAIHDMADAPGFRETLRALEKRQFEDGAAITVPVTVAFGSRDRVLLPGVARRRDELPDQTRWVTLSGLGHIPMFDDPQAVVDLLLRSTDPDTAGKLGKPVR